MPDMPVTVRLRKPAMVIFDVGETLIDETGIWHRIAARFGIPPFTVSAVAGIALTRGLGFREILEELARFSDLPVETWRSPDLLDVGLDDLYPDVVPAFGNLQSGGIKIGICGNQPQSTEDVLSRLPINIDWMSSSARLNLRKPDPAFFNALIDQTGIDAQDILYVGDRLDNDIYPAIRHGMQASWLLRGPWAFAQWHENRDVPDIHISRGLNGLANHLINDLID